MSLIDGLPDPRGMSARLNADIDDLLRHALRVAGNGGVPDDNLRAAAKRVCGMAHAQDLRAEELIIVLKGRWYRLPEVTKRTGKQTEMILDQIITRCINEYFATQ